MQWIKELELDDSVDESRSSLSIRVISMPNFEVLDARIASALNKIIHGSHFNRRISLEERKKGPEAGPFPSRQTVCLLDLRLLLGHWNPLSVENYADLSIVSLRNDDIQEFDSKWDGILLSISEIPHDGHPGRIVEIKNTRV